MGGSVCDMFQGHLNGLPAIGLAASDQLYTQEPELVRPAELEVIQFLRVYRKDDLLDIDPAMKELDGAQEHWLVPKLKLDLAGRGSVAHGEAAACSRCGKNDGGVHHAACYKR